MEHEDALKKSWLNREPWIVQDPFFKREWLVPDPLRYYLFKNNNDEWCVLDRWMDLGVGKPQSTRNKAIREFYKMIGRKIPTGQPLPVSENSKYH